MKSELFNYDLPQELIAQHPVPDRESARMLVLNREANILRDEIFSALPAYIKPGDCIVLNDTKVIPARMYGVRERTGARVEVFLLEPHKDKSWSALCRPAKRVKKGDIFDFDGVMKGRVLSEKTGGEREFSFFGYKDNFWDALSTVGNVPLPPYIKSTDVPFDDYQTVYAEKKGAVAAPTAGLHFTKQMLAALRKQGINIVYTTLHCGLGTFRPVTAENVEDHVMHEEFYSINASAARTINETKTRGGNIWAVGTTTVRLLESTFQRFGQIRETQGTTKLFIYPPFKFNVVDKLITNFHLPKSSLLMLVSAFVGYDFAMKAYKHAVSEKYRFFSFGDAMLIL